jgi:uncharacterized FlaG/YvyC family protein
MSSLGSSLFSGFSSPNSILQSIGISTPSSELKSESDENCKKQLANTQEQLDKTKKELELQQKDVEFLNQTVPDLNTKLDALNQEILQQQNSKMNGPIVTNIPTFYISLAILVLLILLGAIYNQLITKNILKNLEDNGIIDILAKTFKKNDFNVKLNNQEKPFSDYWAIVYNSVLRSITRGRFVLLIGIFLFILSLNLFLYTIVFRGNDVANAAKIVSIICSVVLIITFLIVNNQTMNNPFENVIGYQLIRGELLTDLLTHIFQHKFFEKKHTFPGANLYYDFIISTMNIKNYPTVLEEIYRNSEKYDFKINTDDVEGINKKRVIDLYKLIITKNSVGHVCWMFFASLVSTIISLKYLFASGMLSS